MSETTIVTILLAAASGLAFLAWNDFATFKHYRGPVLFAAWSFAVAATSWDASQLVAWRTIKPHLVTSKVDEARTALEVLTAGPIGTIAMAVIAYVSFLGLLEFRKKPDAAN